MPPLDVAAVGIVVGVLGPVVAVIAWRWPRTRARLRPHEKLRVTVGNHFPVFDHLDGSKTLGDALVAVIVSNGTERPVKVTNWGLHLPGNRNLVLTAPTTTWEPRLPHWIPPGDEATWYLNADEARSQAAKAKVKLKHMRAYVTFADGRQVKADRAIPLR